MGCTFEWAFILSCRILWPSRFKLGKCDEAPPVARRSDVLNEMENSASKNPKLDGYFGFLSWFFRPRFHAIASLVLTMIYILPTFAEYHNYYKATAEV